MIKSPLILASASPRRLMLLKQINIKPDKVIAANINETVLPQEKPKALAMRLSLQKAKHVYQNHPNAFVLGADTVVACGQQIMGKPSDKNQARAYLQKLSQRRHYVYGGITLITPKGDEISRLCRTLVQFKKISDSDINFYIQSNEWQGKAGGYAIQGYAASFIKYSAGSYSNVVGLSLYDTMNILKSGGYEGLNNS